jgi:tRNA pseudouridine55 synthase
MRTTDDTASGGLLLVDKPAGLTSHDVVAIVRRALRTRRVGHCGTLDPFATGLLVVLTGRGTRIIPYIEGEPKVYDATIRFGAETETDDGTGKVVRQTRSPTDAEIADGIAHLTGSIEQVPPAYSAKQVAGTRAYAAARRGAALELAPARIDVHAWQLLGRSEQDLSVRVTCGGGTYVRALARDLGHLTNSAAHLTQLRRVASGPFTVADAVTIDDVVDSAAAPRSLRDAIPSLPSQRLEPAELAVVVHGNPVVPRVAGDRIALVDDEQTLIAIALRAGAELRPKVVLRDA